MITEYVNAGMRNAVYECLPDDSPCYGEIPGLQGVWANAETLAQCRGELREVLEDWLLLGFRLGHDIPTIDGISLVPVKGQ